MVLYLDIIMALNMIFTGLILLLVNYSLRMKLHLIRILFATLFATLYIPLYIYMPHSIIHTLIGKSIYSCFIIFIAFGFTHFRLFFKTLMMFYFISFTVGGGLLSIHYVLDNNLSEKWYSKLFYVSSVQGGQTSLVILFSFFPLLIYVIKRLMNHQIMQQFHHDHIVDVTLSWNNMTYYTKGFVDTGNYLVDPLFHRPVIICNTHVMKQFFTEKEWVNVKQAVETNDPTFIPTKYKHEFIYIPYQGVNGENNLLLAIKPTFVRISDNKKQFEAKKVWIAIRSGAFSDEHDYDCLLHPNVLYINSIQSESA